MSLNNIIFFYPSKIAGGAEYLFARLAKYFSENMGLSVYYIDYNDGFIHSQSEFSKLNFIDYEDNKKTDIDIDGTLITPVSNIYRILDYINIKNDSLKIFFWCIHSLNIIHVLPEARTLQKCTPLKINYILKHFCKNTYSIFRKLLLEVGTFNSIAYMDECNYSFNFQSWGDIVKERYLPIVSQEKNTSAKTSHINDDEINICVLGRLCIEKTLSLINVLNNFNNYKTSKKKIVHIIGDGDSKKLINVNKYNELKIIFKGTIIKEDLDDYLTNNIDILFSMGTSSLEGAALKLPVVLLPFSYKKFNLSNFYYLYESNGYNVGEHVDKYRIRAKHSFDEIINNIYLNGKKAIIGKMCYEYFLKNHSISKVSILLLNMLEQNQLTYKVYSDILSSLPLKKKNKNLIYKIIKGVMKYAR